MRIAIVAEAFHPRPDTDTPTVRALVDRLVEHGHSVHLLAPGPGLGSFRGAPVHRVSGVTGPGRQVRDALHAARPEVVVGVGSGRGPLVPAALHHAQGLAPTVAVQTTRVREADAERWHRVVRRRAGRLLVTTPWLQDEAATAGAGLWLPGVDVAAHSPALRDPWLHRAWARKDRTVVVGHVGPLRKRHDVRRLRALAGLPGTRLVLVGEGVQRRWLAERLPGARFTGALGSGDLATVLATLDVLVQPDEQETCAHALRAAGASGTPVVAPRAGGARHVVRHLETGLLHEPGDPAGLRRAVAALVADRHRGLMGAHARELALSRTWDDAVAELVREHLGSTRPVVDEVSHNASFVTHPSV